MDRLAQDMRFPSLLARNGTLTVRRFVTAMLALDLQQMQ